MSLSQEELELLISPSSRRQPLSAYLFFYFYFSHPPASEASGPGGPVWWSDLLGHSGGLWLSTTSVPPTPISSFIFLRHQESPLRHTARAKQHSHSWSHPTRFSFLPSWLLLKPPDCNHDSCPGPRHSARGTAAEGWGRGYWPGLLPEAWNKSCCKRTQHLEHKADLFGSF